MAATTIRSDTTERHVNKYSNPNPIHRLSLGRFYDEVAAQLTKIAPSSVLDFGCGEGYILDMMAAREVAIPSYEGLDLRADALTEARRRWPHTSFTEANLFDPAYDQKRYHTVMALEVLEHLFEPEKVPASPSFYGRRICFTDRSKRALVSIDEPSARPRSYSPRQSPGAHQSLEQSDIRGVR